MRELDLLRKQTDLQFRAADRFQDQAFNVLVRGVADAFDLSKEDPRLLERYDTGAMKPSDGARRNFEVYSLGGRHHDENGRHRSRFRSGVSAVQTPTRTSHWVSQRHCSTPIYPPGLTH